MSSGGKNLRDPPLSSGLLSTFIVVSEPVVVKALAESFAGNQLDSGQKKQRNFRHVYRRSCADVDIKNEKSRFDNLTRTRRIDRFRRTSPFKIALLLFEEIVGIKDTVTRDPLKRQTSVRQRLNRARIRASLKPIILVNSWKTNTLLRRLLSLGTRCCVIAISRSGLFDVLYSSPHPS